MAASNAGGRFSGQAQKIALLWSPIASAVGSVSTSPREIRIGVPVVQSTSFHTAPLVAEMIFGEAFGSVWQLDNSGMAAHSVSLANDFIGVFRDLGEDF